MNVSKLMRRRVQTCRPTDALAVPARIMRDQRCGFVPVTDSRRRLVGVITDRDVCMALLRLDAALAEVRVEQAMTVDVGTVAPDDPVEKAEHVMRAWRVRRVPVLDPDERVVGVLSIDDLALAAAAPRGRAPVTEHDVAATLSGVVQPSRVIEVAARPTRRRSPARTVKPKARVAKPRAAKASRRR